METKDRQHLQWIYDRMVEVHEENPNYDYMIKFRIILRHIETRALVDLMIKSSDHNPYTGMLSKKDNLIAAIELAKLCKEFADNGQSDEAMNIDSEQWTEVINNLDCMLRNFS